MSSCRCHCFRASARSSAKRGDRLHRQFVIPWSGYRGQENAAPLSRERERERMRGKRHIPLRYSRSRYHRPSDSQPFPPLSKRFFVRHFLSYSFQFSRNSNVSSQKRRFMIEKIQIRKQRSGNVRDGKGWKEADPKQGFGGNPRPHG